MHHLYPSLKGDQLCPLGFHPQTRYPTRCKRCFRDYKEHGGRRGVDDVAASSPNLTDGSNSRPSSRSWTSTQNLSSVNGCSNDIVVHFNVELKKRPQSWASTPDIDEAESSKTNDSRSNTKSYRDDNSVNVTLKLPVPPRRHTTELDIAQVEKSLSQSSSLSTSSKNIPEELVILSSDNLAERVRKMNLLKKLRSQNSRESSRERSLPRKTESDGSGDKENKNPPDRPERTKPTTGNTSLPPVSSSSSSSSPTTPTIVTSNSAEGTKHHSLPPKKTTVSSSSTSNRSISTPSSNHTNTDSKAAASSSSASDLPPAAPKATTTKLKVSSSTTSSSVRRKEAERQKTAQDVEFMLNIKDSNNLISKKQNHDNMSITTEPTDENKLESHFKEEMKALKKELNAMKTRAEKAEREKSDILLRRLASMDTAPNRTAASEALMLQQRVNELRENLEKVSEEKRKLNVRMKELENNPKGVEHELRRKLQAAEQICEELVEENQEAKKEIMNLQAEMDELQDTYRDEDVKAKTNLQKDFEKTTKNCRILSFKLKKCERKLEIMEQERQNSGNEELNKRIKQLEDELRFSQELSKKMQAEADELRNPGKKKPPMLGVLGKSTSADAKFTRESLTRGGSQEDPQQLLRDLKDSVERESDLKDQLKFAEEEAENLRKKVARMEDENDSLMMQLKKMATKSRTVHKLGHTSNRLSNEAQADRDEGISDEDDPAELRLLLELNEQEAFILRHKVDDLEKQYSEAKKQNRELQEKLGSPGDKKLGISALNSSTYERKLKSLNEELEQFKKTVQEKDKKIEQLQLGAKSQNDAALLRSKVTSLEEENDRIVKENKRLQMQALKKPPSAEKTSVPNSTEMAKLKESLNTVERERDSLKTKLNRILQEAEEGLPPRTSIRITDLTPKNQLKKWIEELDDEISEMRAIVLNSGAQNVANLEKEKNKLEEELDKYKSKLAQNELDFQKFKSSVSNLTKSADLEKQLKKSEDDSKQLNSKIKELEEKLKKQENLIKQTETSKSNLDLQLKSDKEKILKLEKECDKERKEKEKLESKLKQKDSEILENKKATEKIKSSFEKDIKELKVKTSKTDTKQVQDLKKQIDDMQESLSAEEKRYTDLNSQWEKLSEETILMRAQLTTEKSNLQCDLHAAKQKIAEMEVIRLNRTELAKKLNDAQKKIQELEAKTLRNNSDHEKAMLQNKLDEKAHEYNRLRRENDMNIDLVFQLRKDNDELSRKLNDFNRIEQAQSSINGHSFSLENEIKSLKIKLENSELQLKSEVASTRLRYEQQVKTLSGELTSIQRQCERFKKDRDAFKQMLESAQKKIGDLKANNTGRQSRSSMHSSDEDDKSKIAYLEQQIGCLEDQLVEARLEASKVKTELVSERSANEIKISEMQSKLNEFEEERVIGSGRTKIAGMKTKLELSWQKEREDQQRLLQETSTLARDLRQTLFEVERERDKERLESKRRLDQLKRATEEEMEEGRKKIAELQCDLLELRDVHAKLRTSNEKLRRERERYEKELVKRRIEQDGGDRKLAALLHNVDELMKIAPDLMTNRNTNTSNELKPEQVTTSRKRSPSPSMNVSQTGTILARLAEASEDLRKFQRIAEEEHERSRIRRSNLRRAASQENDPHGSQSSMASNSAGSHRNGSKLSRSNHNGSLIRKSLSLDHSIQQDQNIWRQDEGSVSSIQSIDSELGGLVRDSSYDSRLDSRLSGGSTQSDIPRGPRKKKKGLMGKLRSLTKSGRNSESEISIQGSDSDISVASDLRSSKRDLRGRLSGMFKRSGSTSRSASAERPASEHRPVAVTVVGDENGPQPREPPTANSVTPKPIRSITKPPTPTTPITKRRQPKP